MYMTRIIPPTHGPAVSPRQTPLFIRVTAEERRRIKMAALEEGLSYAEMVIALLDERDARLERSRRQQAHPLHRPSETLAM